MKKFFAIGIVALALSVGASAAEVYVRIGPPHPRREVIVARPGPAYVWTPGYYAHDGTRYNWVAGTWVLPPHRHAHWVPGHWRHRAAGYYWVPGHWR